jgi:glutamine amidotransferase
MIVVIDIGLGNIGSIINMLKKVGYQAKASSAPHEIRLASKIILPGVGAFDNGMRGLEEFGLVQELNELALGKKIPILGICLGMQLLANRSDEGQKKGLGLLPGEVRKFGHNGNDFKLKIPHMGWNLIQKQREHLLNANLPESPRFYFVHSYHFICQNPEHVMSTTCYGYDFPSIVQNENIMGVQFHPEKSHKFGMQLLKNFGEM